ncbi:MAG: hypothetical protein ACM3JD_10600, partial [Rudaea sp.]
ANVERGLFAALAALFFIGSTFVYHWLPLFRIDLIGLAFAVGGLFCVWKWERESISQGARASRIANHLVIAGFLFLCALYAKHSLLFAPAAAAVAIWLRDRRAAVYWSLSLGLAGGLIFGALDLLTGGGFYFGIVTSNATVWLWDIFLSLTREFAVTYVVLILLAAWGWLERVRDGKIGVLEIYAVTALGSVLLAGRVGAWQNYFFEPIVAVCIFAGLAAARLWQRRPEARWWLPVAFLLQLGLFWDQHDPAIAQRLMEEVRMGNEMAAPIVKNAQGTVIAEDMGLLVTNGKPVDYYTFQYSSLARAGLWDQHWEVDNLRAGRFPVVVLNRGTREDVDHFRNFTREFMSALDYGYALAIEDARYHIYRPSPLDHFGPVDFGGQLELVGWALNRNPVHPGERLTLPVVWRAERKLDANYTAFLHLERANGGVVAQDDHAPRVGLYPDPQPYPTTRWAANEMVRDTFSLTLPSDLAPGTYSLRVGWYEPESDDRLSIKGADDSFELGKVEIGAAVTDPDCPCAAH